MKYLLVMLLTALSVYAIMTRNNLDDCPTTWVSPFASDKHVFRSKVACSFQNMCTLAVTADRAICGDPK